MTATRLRRLGFAIGLCLFAAAFVVGGWRMLGVWGTPRLGLDHLALAKRAQERGDLGSAAAEYAAAVRIAPDDAYSRQRLQRIRHDLTGAAHAMPSAAEATPEALARAEQAIQEAPDDPARQLYYGNLLYRVRRFPEAIAAFERTLALDPHSADAWKGIGLCHGKEDVHDLAAAAFQRALELDPELAPAHNGLGVVYLRLGRTAEARAEFERALSIDPSLEVARVNLDTLANADAEGSGQTTP